MNKYLILNRINDGGAKAEKKTKNKLKIQECLYVNILLFYVHTKLQKRNRINERSFTQLLHKERQLFT